MLRAAPPKRPPRIEIEDAAPLIDGGRYRAKRCVGDRVDVFATIFRDGHDLLRAVVRWRRGAGRWSEQPMWRIDAERGGDRWQGSFPVEKQGRWEWQVEAWTDRFATWRDELERKLAAGQRELDSELAEAVVLLYDTRARADGADAEAIAAAAEVIANPKAGTEARCAAALAPALLEICERHPDRADAAFGPSIELDVERLRARFGSWYELFPRSWGGFAGVIEQLPAFAELGFDVLYFPPIHPIGTSRRKGRNDAEVAVPGDPGSPWAIGSADGGHTAVHPELGTLEEFDQLVARAREQGIEIALDFAIQCSADHPWLSEHPEWFSHRPDGTLKYAENPPKRYYDIYNVDFDCAEWRALWEALRDIVLFWVEHGVRIFRVDNPHTKPLRFWEWLIESVRSSHPDVIFLSEAFTRAAMMQALAKVGFIQSYTYFTWKNSAWELREYMLELTSSGMQDYFRPNFFANTPDILTEYLQYGGPPAFATRLVLAATLSPSYGIYSGFENFEHQPRHPGSEEYLDSEKYELKKRRLDGPLLPLVAELNRLRRDHPALQQFVDVTFLETENDALLAYAKRAGGETLLIVVTLDPNQPAEGIVVVPYELGLPPVFPAVDLIGGERFDWHVGRNYVRLDPTWRVAHLLEAVPG
jgi:starch synthase (maltosyl-transferring)